MGLAEFQAALAHLYTNADARAELRSDQGRFGERYRLSGEETERLAGSVLDDAHKFAGALARKRFSEATKSMPGVEKIVGVRMGDLFARYAAITPLGAQRNPAFDALVFIQWLLNKENSSFSLSDRDALRYEEARILMQHTSRRFLMRWLVVPGAASPSRAFAVWWRFRHRLRHWVSG